jgi:hypothetical protein
MDPLVRQVRKAGRRLAFQHFLHTLSWAWFGTLLAAAVLITIDKFFPLGWSPFGWIAAAIALGLVIAAGWTWWRRPRDLDVALAIDQRFGLRERVSSSLALDDRERESPAGQALVHDAARRLERLEISTQFRLTLGRWICLPLVSAAVAFVVAVFLPPWANEQTAEATTQAAAQKKQIHESSEALRKKLAERRKEAEQKGLKNAEDLFEKLEQGTRQLTQDQPADRKQALVKLNDLAKELEKRRQDLSGSERLREQLQQLKQFQNGPAEKLAQALRQGDFNQAMRELDKLRDQIAAGGLDPKAKEELAKQLGEIEKKFKELADAQRQMQEDLKRAIDQKRGEGRTEEANALEKQLAKLAQQAPPDALQKLADQLGQCAKCMNEGDAQGAAERLDALKSAMSDLAEKLEESKLLREGLDEIAQAKESMNCKQCGGAGCKECQGGHGAGQQENGQGQGKGGDGLGAGRGGKGFRPEQKNGTGSYDTRVRQKVGRGAATVTDLVEGPNAKGRVEQQIKSEWETVRGEAADPLSGQALPRGYRDHAKKYFDSLREGER